jgi:hypothetical protein
MDNLESNKCTVEIKTKPIPIEHYPSCFAIRNKLTGEYWMGGNKSGYRADFADPRTKPKAKFFGTAGTALTTYRRACKYRRNLPDIENVQVMQFVLDPHMIPFNGKLW